MSGKFIYVFNEKDRDAMLNLGFSLLKSDKAQDVYVFENTAQLVFSTKDFDYVLTDMLSF